MYDHKIIEQQAQNSWQINDVFAVDEESQLPKYYVLSMWPYPSGKLHMGHVRNYTISDVIARYKKMNGFNVMHVLGWDAFGLPAENAAIINNVSPLDWTKSNIDNMRTELKSLGLAIDWHRELTTCDPKYYIHQQWLFIQMYKQGLVYRKNGMVNWDPVDNTVLANEQVINGCGWRSGAPVEKRQIPMYFFKITDYAEELLNDLANLDWPEQVKIMQRNWIGKSSGMIITFTINQQQLNVYTTKPETLMGVNFIAISPEHELVKQLLHLQPMITELRQGSTAEADIATREKHGIFTGLYAEHPITKAAIPIWVANYVLNHYGTGAIMGVPLDSEPDLEFANKYNIHLSEYTKLTQSELTDLVTQKIAQQVTTYRLRDWGISRQRYWGCPIPIIHCDNCGILTVPEETLPILLPDTYKLLSQNPEFYNTTCHQCGQPARRETDTMDTFVDSSWYYLRYASYNSNNTPIDQRANYWCPVDQYIGGIEHAVLHLLYARFIHKAIRDLGLVNSNEPFTKLLTQGMVLANTYYQIIDNKKIWLNPQELKFNSTEITAQNGLPMHIGGLEKMSKSKNNGVDPLHIINKYGADTARLFMMFVSAPTMQLEWSNATIEGSKRFINKLWDTVHAHQPINTTINWDNLNSDAQKIYIDLHNTIAKVNHDIEHKQQFNTAISSIMTLLNSYHDIQLIGPDAQGLAQELLESVVIMLSPIIPHVCDALWQYLRTNTRLLDQAWVKPNLNIISKLEKIEIVIQVNGKLRSRIIVNINESPEQIKLLAMQDNKILNYIQDAKIKNVIFVPNKLVNIVID